MNGVHLPSAFEEDHEQGGSETTEFASPYGHAPAGFRQPFSDYQNRLGAVKKLMDLVSPFLARRVCAYLVNKGNAQLTIGREAQTTAEMRAERVVIDSAT